MSKPKPKIVRAVHPNAGVRARYHKDLERLVSEMSKSVTYWLEAAYKANPPRMGVAMDALPSQELVKRMRELSKRWIDRFNEMADTIAKRFVQSGVNHTDKAFMSALKDAGFTVKFQMTPIMRDAVNASIAENVSLIKSIPQKYFTEVEGTVMRGYTRGHDLGYITEELTKRYGITSRRAAFIARDQTNKLAAVATQARRIDLGLYEAEWQHSGAGKEPRHSHVMAGKEKMRFDVRKGAYIDGEYILPGQKPNCKCGSRTILPF